MNGIEARPTAVVVHLRTGEGRRVDHFSVLLHAQQIRLMVNPGTTTEANPCQTNESTTA